MKGHKITFFFDNKKLLLFFILLALIPLFLYFLSPPFLESLENSFYDLRFQYNSESTPSTHNLTIIEIDDRSIEQFGRWPWSRETTSELLKEIISAEPAIIALDMVFSEKEHPLTDKLLADIIGSYNTIITGFFFKNNSEKHSEPFKEIRKSRLKIIKGDISGTHLPTFDDMTINISEIQSASTRSGFLNVFPDPDGVYRRVPLIIKSHNDIYPSLTLQTLQTFYGEDAFLSIDRYGARELYLNDIKIPVSPDGTAPINFYNSGDNIPTLSASLILNQEYPLENLKNRIILIGVTDLGVSDFKSTPVDETMPGIELQAHFLKNFLLNEVIYRDFPVYFIEIAFMLAVPFLILLFSGKKSHIAWGIVLMLAMGYMALNYIIFYTAHQSLYTIYPLMSLTIVTVLGQTYRSVVILKKSRYISKAFASYLAPEVVDIISRNPDKLQLGGENRVVSCLFTDIRDFTTISEKYNPRDLVMILNETLQPCADSILKYRGMIDKYIGDAIMALFNVPLDLENHADMCVKAACEMVNSLGRLNEQWKLSGRHEVKIGVGINTGIALVGNMGTEDRFDYTAIGDAVNLSSRLEGMNKIYGTEIIISDNTKRALKEEYRIIAIDRTKVKGREAPVLIYALFPNDSPVYENLKGEFQKALDLYFQSNFSNALEIFKKLNRKSPCRLIETYIARCESKH